MHQVLLIDEIVQDIFELCFEYADGGKEKLHDLCQVARCCKAWKDPALDRLWRRLPCVIPLLSLIPGLFQVDGVFVHDRCGPVDLSIFRAYTRRVKHITHRGYVRIHPDVLSLLTSPSSSGSAADILPSLTTVNIPSTGCLSLCSPLSVSEKLVCLNLDVGFKRGSDSAAQNGTEDAVSDFLEQVARAAPGIERINMRGMACRGLNNALSSMMRLRVLSLRTGNTLTPTVLATISSLPLLAELELHAGHIKVGEFEAALPRQQHAWPFFPSLQKLHVRGHTHLIEFILGHLIIGTLHTLRIEAEGFEATAWEIIFTSLASKATHTLEALTIEHHIEIDDDTPSSRRRHLTIDTLAPLAPLYNLRLFTINMSFPPDLCDTDMARLVTWWPMIEYLDLGYIEPILECALHGDWYPRATLASLVSFSRCCSRLISLTLPLHVGDFDFDSNLGVDTGTEKAVMQRLSIGSRERPDDALMPRYLGRLFPRLSKVQGTASHEREWEKVETALLEMRQHGLESCAF